MMELVVTTGAAIEAKDVTDLVATQDLADGAYLVATPHTTAALLLSEVDEDLVADLERTASGLLQPFEPYKHARQGNPNASAHLLSSLFGTQVVLVVDHGELALGRYQRLVLLELDGPRRRSLRIQPLQGIQHHREEERESCVRS
jgi:secondary thiamine-phosphate synthase enzyme